MDEELYLGIPGVDAPYPKYVQDALDLVESETRKTERADFPPEIYGPTNWELRQLDGLWTRRRKEREAVQKKQSYQPYDRADQWPLF